MLDKLEKKLREAERRARNQKRRYWKLRLAVIAYLGGKCCKCNETDVKKLEIHHLEPHRGGGYKHFSGWEIMKEWKKILAGELEARLYCHEHHIHDGHNGNTCTLKKEKQ